MKEMKLGSVILVVVLLILGLTVYVVPVISGENGISQAQVKALRYTPFGVIRINSNAEFNTTAQANGWPGNGTAEDPYIISGYSIDAHGAGAAIYIGNTTVYFTIENCYLHNASYHSWPYAGGAGIILYNVTNAHVINNTLTQNEKQGLHFVYSHNSTAENNHANETKIGFSADRSSNITFLSNLADNLSSSLSGIFGFSFNSSSNITLENDTCIHSQEYGVYITYSQYITMVNCTFSYNGEDGVKIYKSDHFLFINSNCSYNTGDGICISYSNNVTIEKDICINSQQSGVYMYYSQYINVMNSTFSYNGNDGVNVYEGSNILFVNNSLIYNTGDGMYLVYSYDITLDSDTCAYSQQFGVYAYYSQSIRIVNCDVSYNGKDGVKAYGSRYILLVDNNISYNSGDAIYLPYSYNNVLYNNTMIHDSIFLDGDKKAFTTQEISTNNTVNGKPVYYYKNADMNNSSVPLDAGEVILGNITNFYITDLSLNYDSVSIEIGYSDHLYILNNSCSQNNWDGIRGYFVNYSYISNNTCAYDGRYGIGLFNSYNNIITNNALIKSKNYGIYMVSCSGNYIYKNIFYENSGSGGTYNLFYIQAYDDVGNNYWNSTAGVGNYWYDWANNNNTNDQNGDGIVDWPYSIAGANAKDYYPLKYSVPTPPENLVAKSGNEYVNLTWSKPVCNGSTPITEYLIYRNGKLIAIVPSTQLYYNDTNVVNGQTYYYYVIAVNKIGSSLKSNIAQGTPTATVPEFTFGIVYMLFACLLFMFVLWQRRSGK